MGCRLQPPQAPGIKGLLLQKMAFVNPKAQSHPPKDFQVCSSYPAGPSAWGARRNVYHSSRWPFQDLTQSNKSRYLNETCSPSKALYGPDRNQRANRRASSCRGELSGDNKLHQRFMLLHIVTTIFKGINLTVCTNPPCFVQSRTCRCGRSSPNSSVHQPQVHLELSKRGGSVDQFLPRFAPLISYRTPPQEGQLVQHQVCKFLRRVKQ